MWTGAYRSRHVGWHFDEHINPQPGWMAFIVRLNPALEKRIIAKDKNILGKWKMNHFHISCYTNFIFIVQS